jgi:hypothetical protein
MALQLRTTLPDGVSGQAYQREIARLLDNAAMDILNGVPPERYQAAVARYAVLHELLAFAEDEVEKQHQGESIALE